MKKISIISIIFATSMLYVSLSGAGFKIKTSTLSFPMAVEIGLEDGNIRGGILMPGQTLEIDAKLSAITSLKFSKGCRANLRIFESEFRFPPKHEIVELRFPGKEFEFEGRYDIVADDWGLADARLIYGKK